MPGLLTPNTVDRPSETITNAVWLVVTLQDLWLLYVVMLECLTWPSMIFQELVLKTAFYKGRRCYKDCGIHCCAAGAQVRSLYAGLRISDQALDGFLKSATTMETEAVLYLNRDAIAGRASHLVFGLIIRLYCISSSRLQPSDKGPQPSTMSQPIDNVAAHRQMSLTNSI